MPFLVYTRPGHVRLPFLQRVIYFLSQTLFSFHFLRSKITRKRENGTPLQRPGGRRSKRFSDSVHDLIIRVRRDTRNPSELGRFTDACGQSTKFCVVRFFSTNVQNIVIYIIHEQDETKRYGITLLISKRVRHRFLTDSPDELITLLTRWWSRDEWNRQFLEPRDTENCDCVRKNSRTRVCSSRVSVEHERFFSCVYSTKCTNNAHHALRDSIGNRIFNVIVLGFDTAFRTAGRLSCLKDAAGVRCAPVAHGPVRPKGAGENFLWTFSKSSPSHPLHPPTCVSSHSFLTTPVHQTIRK